VEDLGRRKCYKIEGEGGRKGERMTREWTDKMNGKGITGERRGDRDTKGKGM
jgi:hypothetical protein